MGSGTAGQPITVQFQPGAKLSEPYCDTTYGCLSIVGQSYVSVDGNHTGVIEATANGTGLANQQPDLGIYLQNTSNIVIENLTIQNLYVHSSPTDTAISSKSQYAIEDYNGNNNEISGNIDPRHPGRGLLPHRQRLRDQQRGRPQRVLQHRQPAQPDLQLPRRDDRAVPVRPQLRARLRELGHHCRIPITTTASTATRRTGAESPSTPPGTTTTTTRSSRRQGSAPSSHRSSTSRAAPAPAQHPATTAPRTTTCSTTS